MSGPRKLALAANCLIGGVVGVGRTKKKKKINPREVGRIHSDMETLGVWLYSTGGEVYTKQRPTLDIKSETPGVEPRTQS